MRMSAANRSARLLLMASLQASLRGQIITGEHGLASLMAIHPPVELLQWGHNPPLVLHPDGTTEKLETGGPIVSLFRQAKYEAGVCQLTSGGVLTLFTDGISEAMNAAEDESGEERLEAIVRNTAGMPAVQAAQAAM